MSCEYEKLRQKNIERNNAILKQLGLVRKFFKEKKKKLKKFSKKKSPKKKKVNIGRNLIFRKSNRLKEKIETKIQKKNPKLKKFYERKTRRRVYESEEDEEEGKNGFDIDDMENFICDEVSFVSSQEEEEEEEEENDDEEKKEIQENKINYSFLDEEDDNDQYEVDIQEEKESKQKINPIIDFTNSKTKYNQNESCIEDSDLDDEQSQFTIPIIMFTGIPNPEKYENAIKKLGGRIENENISKITHLISTNIKRTTKFLCAISNGCKYFLTIDWLENSIKKKYFLQENSYFIEDIEMESKYDFILKDSIFNANQKKIFEGMKFFITPNTFPNIFELKKIIKYGRGIVILDKEKVSIEMIHLQIISCEEDKEFCRKQLPYLPRLNFHTIEFICDCILKQIVNLKRHLLKL